MFKLFSGSAHPQLSQEVSRLLHIPLSKAEVVRFGNSEVKVTIQEDVKHTTCYVLQPIANPTDTHLMEFFFFCDALRRQEARKVIGIIPYFGYARQDIQHRPGECVSVNVIIRFFESIGFAKIYTVDIHDEATEGVFSIPFKNLSSLSLLAREVKEYLSDSNRFQPFGSAQGKPIPTDLTDLSIVVSPDQGGVERARDFGTYFYGTEDFSLGVVEKRRSLDKIHQSKAIELYGEVDGKIVILVDDIITSGNTLINAANLCLTRGAKKVLAAVVHHDLPPTPPISLISPNSPIQKLFTTNTIALKPEQKFAKLHEISIASLISEELKPFIK